MPANNVKGRKVNSAFIKLLTVICNKAINNPKLIKYLLLNIFLLFLKFKNAKITC